MAGYERLGLIPAKNLIEEMPGSAIISNCQITVVMKTTKEKAIRKR